MRKYTSSVIMAITIASLLSCDLQGRAEALDMKGKHADEKWRGRDEPPVKDETPGLVVQNG